MGTLRPNGTFNRNLKQDNEISSKGAIASSTVETNNSIAREQLRGQARWIRDVLDPQVARDGQDALHSDDLLTMDEILRELLESNIDREDILYSRIHLAVSMVAGLATRWPRKLIEKCDLLKEVWSERFGRLQDILLYEPGGRLHGICKPEDVDKEKLVVKWLKTPGVRLSPMVARKAGHLGFEPGDWWISPLFAYRDGIIDSGSSEGGIVCDGEAAYAVVMTGGDEVFGGDGETIRYRARSNDPGRYRLSAASIESRHPIRILRSHTLNSMWKPRTGLRYEGLYKITGWSVKHNTRTNEVDFVVKFRRLPAQAAFETVLARPWTEEVEDYREYKRLRDLKRSKSKENKKPDTVNPVPVIDGMLHLRRAGVPSLEGDDQPSCNSSSESECYGESAGSGPPLPARCSRHDSVQQDGESSQHPEQLARSAYWIRRTSSSVSVQTVCHRQRTPSEAEIAAQLAVASWDQR
ncbi:putative PUA-like superfamily, SRA-YDG superfamily protein [Septoria linicola]|nr:putative PUA-like superfamily, SRA-YDG superfamily protein [Septoria linicola]